MDDRTLLSIKYSLERHGYWESFSLSDKVTALSTVITDILFFSTLRHSEAFRYISVVLAANEEYR